MGRFLGLAFFQTLSAIVADLVAASIDRAQDLMGLTPRRVVAWLVGIACATLLAAFVDYWSGQSKVRLLQSLEEHRERLRGLRLKYESGANWTSHDVESCTGHKEQIEKIKSRLIRDGVQVVYDPIDDYPVPLPGCRPRWSAFLKQRASLLAIPLAFAATFYTTPAVETLYFRYVATPTPTIVNTPTPAAIETATISPIATVGSPTATPTFTSQETASLTPTSETTHTVTPTSSQMPVPSSTASPTDTPIPTSSRTVTATATAPTASTPTPRP